MWNVRKERKKTWHRERRETREAMNELLRVVGTKVEIKGMDE